MARTTNLARNHAFYEYHPTGAGAGQLKTFTHPDCAAISYDYDLNGRVNAQTGSADYPVRYSYDTTDGWMKALKTYRDGDGWNCLLRAMAIGYEAATWEQGYIWGSDLGGARLLPSPDFLQSAGGGGGLLIQNYKLGTLSIRRLVGYDGNGNVTTLADGANGQLWALYEYDAFGNPTRHHNAIGTHADDNPYRFSTKPMDDETGLVYYGYRYYSPALGRWISRNPIGEEGGLNLSSFLNGDGVNSSDILGLNPMTHPRGAKNMINCARCGASPPRLKQTLPQFNFADFFDPPKEKPKPAFPPLRPLPPLPRITPPLVTVPRATLLETISAELPCKYSCTAKESPEDRTTGEKLAPCKYDECSLKEGQPPGCPDVIYQNSRDSGFLKRIGKEHEDFDCDEWPMLTFIASVSDSGEEDENGDHLAKWIGYLEE